MLLFIYTMNLFTQFWDKLLFDIDSKINNINKQYK